MMRRIALFTSILTTSALAQSVPPSGLASARIVIPVDVDDFSNLAEPAKTLIDRVSRGLAESGVVPETHLARDEQGTGVRFASDVQRQIRAEVAEALRHDGYAGRIWIWDPIGGRLVKVVVALYPAGNPDLSGVVLAHESGHAATHERAVEIARDNATIGKVPAKKVQQWIQEIQKAEDSGARLYHQRVGTTAVENRTRLGERAEDPATLEAIGIEAASEALVPLQPFSGR